MVASPTFVHTTAEAEVIDTIADTERWLSIRRNFTDSDANIPEIDYIIRESLKTIETYQITGHYDTQLWILERLIALRKDLDILAVETTELSTAIHHRLKALVEMKTIVRKVVPSPSPSIRMP